MLQGKRREESISILRGLGWWTMAVLSTFVALYALSLLFMPGMGPPFIAERRASMPLPVILHFGGSLWALAVGPWQLHERFRERAFARHRWLGRSYVLGVLLGGLGGLMLAPLAQTGAMATLGFTALAVLWLSTTVMAFARIRQGNQVAHRRWMIRSFALTLAAVTLRFYLPISLIAGIAFETAYPWIAWLSWVPNLIVAELLLARQSRGAVLAA